MASRIVAACAVVLVLLVGCGGNKDLDPIVETETSFRGSVSERTSGQPIEGVEVRIRTGTQGDGDVLGSTNDSGRFDVTAGPGIVTDGELGFLKAGFTSSWRSIPGGLTVIDEYNFEALVELQRFISETVTTVYGVVSLSGTSMGLPEVSVSYRFGSSQDALGTTDATGNFDVVLGVGLVNSGTLVFHKDGHVDVTREIPKEVEEEAEGLYHVDVVMERR